MRKLFLGLGAIAGMLLLSATLVLACGDKLLVLHRGLRFQDFAGSTVASILLYEPQSPASNAFNDGQLESTLVKAGHKLRRVGEQTQLDEAVKSGHYDLVLVALSDATAVEEALHGTPSPPVVVPVVHEASKAEAQQAKKHFRCMLKAPDKAGNYLNAIDRALNEKAKRDHVALHATK